MHSIGELEMNGATFNGALYCDIPTTALFARGMDDAELRQRASTRRMDPAFARTARWVDGSGGWNENEGGSRKRPFRARYWRGSTKFRRNRTTPYG
ncbi:MAG TPA: hypothetical protein VGM92_13970 [Candidatus Kapabacteria bacterium]